MDSASKVVFFDLGGVLVDVDMSASYDAWEELTGADADDFDRVFFRSGIKAQWDRGARAEDTGLHWAQTLTRHFPPQSELKRVWNAMIRFREDMVEFIGVVARHARIGVISNTDPIHGALIQEHPALDRLVRTWTLSCDVRAVKPEPAIFEAALRAADIHASQAVLVDDREENVAGAVHMGLGGVVFENPRQLKAELRHFGIKL